jgi:hypothetical protein
MMHSRGASTSSGALPTATTMRDSQGLKGHNFHGVFEGDPMEVHKEVPPVSVDYQEEHDNDKCDLQV